MVIIMETSQQKKAIPKYQLSSSPRAASKSIRKLGGTKSFTPYMNQDVAGLTTPAHSDPSSVVANQDAIDRAGGSFFSLWSKQFGINQLMNMISQIRKMYGMFQQARSVYSTFQSLISSRAVTTAIQSAKIRHHAGSSSNESRASVRSSCRTITKKQRTVRK